MATQSVWQQIIEGIGDAVIAADARGTITLWNAGAETIFGFTAEEAIGQTLDLIVPEKQRTRHWEGYDRVMATGETRYSTGLLSVPAVRKDGSRISVEFTIALLRDEAGATTGTAAVMRDVTAQWAEMRRLRAEAGGSSSG